MKKEKKGRPPDYRGDGIAVWKNTDKKGNEYLTVQLLGWNGIRINAFPNK